MNCLETRVWSHLLKVLFTEAGFSYWVRWLEVNVPIDCENKLEAGDARWVLRAPKRFSAHRKATFLQILRSFKKVVLAGLAHWLQPRIARYCKHNKWSLSVRSRLSPDGQHVSEHHGGRLSLSYLDYLHGWPPTIRHKWKLSHWASMRTLHL